MSSSSRYAKFFSKVASKRQPSAIRSLLPLTKLPGMISLAGGLPNPEQFPIDSFQFSLKDGTQLKFTNEEVSTSLQYSQTDGLPKFVEWIKKHQKVVHNVDEKRPFSVIVTTGSQDALSKSFELLLDEGDVCLVENPTYSGALAALNPLGCELLPIECDNNGIIPEELEKVLQKRSSSNMKMPKCLYTIPTGQNPSGCTLTLERKKKIYALAKQFDFIILEDDPYYYLHLEPQQQNNSSFFSIDEDARVLRFDSFSKILSAGIRIGFCSGPEELVTRLNWHMQANELHTSCISQMVTYKVLEHWGMEGLQNHVKQVQSFYRTKRDEFISLVDQYLKDYVTYDKPVAGMFLWMKLKGIEDSKQLIETKARDKKVLLVPGQAFSALNKPGPYVRASFSIESKENMELALQRLRDLLEQEIKNKSE